MSLDDADDFAVYPRGEREVVIEYGFDAPPERVFRAWTDCASMAHWYGPVGHELIVCELELRAGGAWRFVTRDESGQETGLRGVYREVEPPSRIVNTETWEGVSGHETVVTTTFEPVGGGTRLTTMVEHPSAETRAGHLDPRAEEGVRQTFSRLAAYLHAPRG